MSIEGSKKNVSDFPFAQQGGAGSRFRRREGKKDSKRKTAWKGIEGRGGKKKRRTKGGGGRGKGPRSATILWRKKRALRSSGEKREFAGLV